MLQMTAPDSMPLAFKDEASEELVADVYKHKGLLQQPLADPAADAVRAGSFDSSSPWLKAFETVRWQGCSCARVAGKVGGGYRCCCLDGA
jgi:hypothetical protein